MITLLYSNNNFHLLTECHIQMVSLDTWCPSERSAHVVAAAVPRFKSQGTGAESFSIFPKIL